jgi:uncharacterized membrane protein
MTPLAKKLAVALVISVALNLLAVGFFVGRGLRHGPGKHGDAPGFVGPDARLPRHPALREAMDRHRADFAARREAVMQARKAVAEAAGREPFDRAALEQALADLRKQTGLSQEAIHRALVEACEKAKPEERRTLAAQFLKAQHARGR